MKHQPELADLHLVAVDSTAVSTGSRLTYVPLRLPTSTTTNSPASLPELGVAAETVTSSRKMSLSG